MISKVATGLYASSVDMDDSCEIAAFRKLAAKLATTPTQEQSDGQELEELCEQYPWFRGYVVGTYGDFMVLFVTEPRCFLSFNSCRVMEYLGDSARTSWEVFCDGDAHKNALFCDRFEARFMKKATWFAIEKLLDDMEDEQDLKRTEELAHRLLETSAPEGLTSWMVYKFGRWMTYPNSRDQSRHLWTDLFTRHVVNVDRKWWPREFGPSKVFKSKIPSHYTVAERNAMVSLHTYPWPQLDKVEAALLLERIISFRELTAQKLGLMREMMTRHRMCAPFDMTLWRATSEFDGVNPMLAFTMSRGSAEKFRGGCLLFDRQPIYKIDIPAGTEIFPVVVYAQYFKVESEILIPTEVALKHYYLDPDDEVEDTFKGFLDNTLKRRGRGRVHMHRVLELYEKSLPEDKKHLLPSTKLAKKILRLLRYTFTSRNALDKDCCSERLLALSCAIKPLESVTLGV